MKTCETCGIQFESTDVRKRRCKTSCRTTATKNPARQKKRDSHVLRFVGVDGEGVTLENGEHRYVLLSVGEESYSRNGEHLEYGEIFTFLYEYFLRNLDATYVGYYLGYDFTQWLRSFPEERARMLITEEGKKKRERRLSGDNRIPFPVEIGEWEVDYLEGKRFKLRKDKGPWMYICDAGPYYQTSFANAVNPAKALEPVCTAEEYATIREGKERRSNAILDADMRRYNVTENIVMSRLMARLNRGFVDMGIKIARPQWFGPGQAATRWLENIEAPTTQQIIECTPEAVRDAARASYYGGWFEVFQHGPIPGTTYEYDINSAYPHIISSLPCLLHGKWVEGGSTDPRGITLVDVTARYPKPHFLGVLPHREVNGTVGRPLETRGWHWIEEVIASAEVYKIFPVKAEMTYHNVWSYIPCDCPPPFAGIKELYRNRLEVGKNTPTGVAYKLIYNSTYGKIAQSVGNPKHSTAIYASLITSGCRTMIADAIATHPGGAMELVMVATDGVYFRSEHPYLDINPTELGKWDMETKQNLTTFKPGVYWDDKTRESLGSDRIVIKSRGVNARDLAECIDDIDRDFANYSREAWPELRIPVRFSMVSAKSSLARNRWNLAGTVSTTGDRLESSNPSSKRSDLSLLNYNGARQTLPYRRYTTLETNPYEKRFGDEVYEESEDGDISMEISHLLTKPDRYTN